MSGVPAGDAPPGAGVPGLLGVPEPGNCAFEGVVDGRDRLPPTRASI